MNQYYSYVYLDEESINLLYPQVFDDIFEKTINQSNEAKTNAVIKGDLLGIISSNLDNEEKSLRLESVKIHNSISKKAQQLIDYFKKDTFLIQEIISKNQPMNESIFFVGKTTFFLSDIYNKENGISLFDAESRNGTYLRIDNNSMFILESGNTSFIKQYATQYLETDDYYELNMSKQDLYGIMMHLSNAKIKKDIRHLTNKIKRAKHFNFFVFGQLIKLSDEFYKISPLAIWQ